MISQAVDHRQPRRDSNTLHALFEPRSIAIVGASRDRSKWGRRVLENAVDFGFDGPLYGINPNIGTSQPADAIQYVSALSQIDADVDLAFLALPASKTPEAIRDCVRSGVNGIVLTGSGFAETRGRGILLEDEIREILKGTPCRALGPNGFGLFSAPHRVNLTTITNIPVGRVGLVSQSGNVAIALIGEAARSGIGFSHCVGVGNQLDVSIGDVLTFFSADLDTDVVACYVEGLPAGQGDSFRDGLSACRNAGKQVVVLRSGTSTQGAISVTTHTGALAADDKVWGAVFQAAGVVRVSSTQALVDALSCQVMLGRNSGRTLILTNGGGDSVMAADAVAEHGLTLARPRRDTILQLETLTPRDAPRVPSGNPVTLDTAGGADDDPELIARCVNAASGDPSIDVVLIAGVFGGSQHLRAKELACAEALLSAAKQGTRLVIQSAYADAGEEPLELLRQGGVPVFSTVQRLTSALASTVLVPQHYHQPAIEAYSPSRESTMLEPDAPLSLTEAAGILASCGVDIPEFHLIYDLKSLRKSVDSFTYPACLKLADPDVSHKSDVGGVRLGLQTEAALTSAASDLWDRFPLSPLVVMPMLSDGFELLLGTITDRTFGPMIMVGRGGIWAEVDEDVVLSPAPLDQTQAEAAILRLRCAPIILGGRGKAPLDLDALSNIMSRLSLLAAKRADLAVEINPLICWPKGCGVADLRIHRLTSTCE